MVLDARTEKKVEVEVTARLRNVPAQTAVRLLADMAGLEAVWVNNVLYVTTPENAAKLEKSKQKWAPPPSMIGPGGVGGPGIGGGIPDGVPRPVEAPVK